MRAAYGAAGLADLAVICSKKTARGKISGAKTRAYRPSRPQITAKYFADTWLLFAIMPFLSIL
jgi:hypothetical protein